MSSEKTEEPTDKKLEDARQRGEVAMSRDVTSLFVFVGVLGFLFLTGRYFKELFFELWAYIWMHLADNYGHDAAGDTEAARGVLSMVLQGVVVFGVGLSLVVLMFAAAATLLQVRFMFAIEALHPKLERLDPVQGFKKLFSMRSLINLVKMLIVSYLVGYGVYHALVSAIDPIMALVYQPLAGIEVLGGQLLLQITLAAGVVFLIQAVVDFGLQRHWFMKGQRMSKDEIKQEYKNAEGDPHIKGKRKQMHRELNENRTLEDTRQANVLVVNPEHLAIALVYDANQDPLPMVVAKGEDGMALQMRKIAEKERIPILRNVKLARALHEQTQAFDYIPEDMMEQISEVLKWAEKQRNKNME